MARPAVKVKQRWQIVVNESVHAAGRMTIKCSSVQLNSHGDLECRGSENNDLDVDSLRLVVRRDCWASFERLASLD